jgi:hypothetical protein
VVRSRGNLTAVVAERSREVETHNLTGLLNKLRILFSIEHIRLGVCFLPVADYTYLDGGISLAGDKAIRRRPNYPARTDLQHRLQ